MGALAYIAFILGAILFVLIVYWLFLALQRTPFSASLRMRLIVIGAGVLGTIIIALLFFDFHVSESPPPLPKPTAIVAETPTSTPLPTIEGSPIPVSSTPPSTPPSTPIPKPTPTSAITSPPTLTISPTPIPTTAPTRQPNPTPVRTLIIDIPQSSLDIVLDTPATMQKDVSYAIKVSLVPRGNGPISDLPIEKATATASDVTAVGTPGATLRQAFGPGFESPFGEATMRSKAFDIEPDGPEKQPLDQPKVVWGWSITPRTSGTQYLTVTIGATWKTTKGDERGSYRIGDRTFSIDVKDAFVSPGHLDVGAILTSLPAALITALLGAGGLGALFIIRIVSRRRGTKNTTTTGGQAQAKQNVKSKRRRGGRRRP